MYKNYNFDMKFLRIKNYHLNEDFLDDYENGEEVTDDEVIKKLAKDQEEVYYSMHLEPLWDLLFKWRYVYCSLFTNIYGINNSPLCKDSLFNSGDTHAFTREFYFIQTTDNNKYKEYFDFINKKYEKFEYLPSKARNMFERCILGRCNKMIYGVFNYFIAELSKIIKRPLNEIDPAFAQYDRASNDHNYQIEFFNNYRKPNLKHLIEMMKRAGIESISPVNTSDIESALGLLINQLYDFLVGILNNAPDEFKVLIDKNKEKVEGGGKQYFFDEKIVRIVAKDYYLFFSEFIKDLESIEIIKEFISTKQILSEEDFINTILVKTKIKESDLNDKTAIFDSMWKYSQKLYKALDEVINNFDDLKLLRIKNYYGDPKYSNFRNHGDYRHGKVELFYYKDNTILTKSPASLFGDPYGPYYHYGHIPRKSKIGTAKQYIKNTETISKVGLRLLYMKFKDTITDDNILLYGLKAGFRTIPNHYDYEAEEFEKWAKNLNFTFKNEFDESNCTKQFFENLMNDKSLDKYINAIIAMANAKTIKI